MAGKFNAEEQVWLMAWPNRSVGSTMAIASNMSTLPTNLSSNGIYNEVTHYGNILHNRIQDVIYFICIPVISLLGCVGNIINLIVLIKGRGRLRSPDGARHSGTHNGLVLLSISDLLFCLAIFPRALTNITGTMAVFTHRSFGLFYQAYGTGVITTLILTSTWITVTMALLRYLAVCNVFSMSLLYNSTNVRVIYLTAVIASIAANLPSFWQYQILQTEIQESKVYLIDLGSFAIQTQKGKGFLWWKTTFGIIIPALILGFCNISLALTIRQSFRRRPQATMMPYTTHKHHIQYTDRTTRMLVVIVLLFIGLVFPCEIMDFFHDVIKMNPAKTEIFLVVRSVANLLQVLNFSCNFSVYCILNGHFRAVAKGLITCHTNPPHLAMLKRVRLARGRKSTANRHIITATNMEMQNHQNNRGEYNNAIVRS